MAKNDTQKPCDVCPWLSKESHDRAALTPDVKQAAKDGQWFCCHVNLGTCYGAVLFGAAKEMPRRERSQ